MSEPQRVVTCWHCGVVVQLSAVVWVMSNDTPDGEWVEAPVCADADACCERVRLQEEAQ